MAELRDSYYDFEIERIIREIREARPKTVCLQLPEGLRPYAKEIFLAVQEKTDAKVYLWGGSNFGACDLPQIPVDLLVHFGHSRWN